MSPLTIALVGFGKIARDQHLPALDASASWTLAAVADPATPDLPYPVFSSLTGLLASGLAFDAVALCTPPQMRHALARQAIDAGKHVLLEKPPAASLAELEDLTKRSAQAGTSIYTAWHSQHAPALEPARQALEGRSIAWIDVHWHEDARRWHPGQDWLWRAGGLGVFDPGINALSILTALVGPTLLVRRSDFVVPINCETPIAVELVLETEHGALATARFDFRRTGEPVWTIHIGLFDGGTIKLREGGAMLEIDGAPIPCAAPSEYHSIYAAFADLVACGASSIDAAPLRCVSDAFLRAHHSVAAAYADGA